MLALSREENVPSSMTVDLEYELSELSLQKKEVRGTNCLGFRKEEHREVLPKEMWKPPRRNKCLLCCRLTDRLISSGQSPQNNLGEKGELGLLP